MKGEKEINRKEGRNNGEKREYDQRRGTARRSLDRKESG
jgi:hypothetical protein